jgi:hypothetical protein
MPRHQDIIPVPAPGMPQNAFVSVGIAHAGDGHHGVAGWVRGDRSQAFSLAFRPRWTTKAPS